MFSANGMVISLTLVVCERICGQVESIYAQIVKSVRARIKFIL
jgi:hypothetical protein